MEQMDFAEAIEALFKASWHVNAYPVFPDGTELAPEVLAALECGMSTALVAASAIAKGATIGATPEQIAANMKMTAVQMYVESVMFSDEEPEGEVEHEREQE